MFLTRETIISYLTVVETWRRRMAKASVRMASGALVTVEGTEDEIVALVMRLEEPRDANSERPKANNAKLRQTARVTPMRLISDLVADGFFAEPRDLGAVRSALKDGGHFYPTTTLSPVMLRLVRKKEMRRIKEKGRWLYVG
jgi:hypothetical protein